MSEFDAHKQVFGLSLMANSVRTVKGTQETIQKAMEEQLPLLLKQLPGWEVVWGPVVWKHDPNEVDSGPDHVFFVAKNPGLAFSNGEKKETYVLAIAASATPYNKEENNLRVDHIIDFHTWLKQGISTDPEPLAQTATSPDDNYTALGTALGVFRLASVAPPSSAASPGVTLPTYWDSFPPSPNTRVIFTGHSLGGALSPTLALALLESGKLHSFTPSNLFVYPTAGPSPGNLVFAKLFSEKFPKIDGPGYQVWNCNLVNRLDPVAQAWCTSGTASPEQNLSNVPPMYGPAPLEITAAVYYAIQLADISDMIYMPLQVNWFQGTPPTTKPSNKKDFMKVAKQQHKKEYYKLFGIDDPEVAVLTGEEDDLQAMTGLEEVCTEPLLCDLLAHHTEAEEKQEVSRESTSYRVLSEDFAAH